MSQPYDCVVLGAGIVGISCALHLQQRGRSVLLIDRGEPARETSYGNAGLIQREGVYPYAFPMGWRALLRYAGNRRTDARYQPMGLLSNASFLWRYWLHSRPASHERVARTYATLIEHCLSEHEALSAAADAGHLLRRSGWIKVFRSGQERDKGIAEAEKWQREFGVRHVALDPAALVAQEPHLRGEFAGGLLWPEPASAEDPHALAMAYFQRFRQLGGDFLRGYAETLAPSAGRWSVRTVEGVRECRDAVVALGPWSDVLTRRLGYRLPLAVKRGYHMHYRMPPETPLHHPVLDTERGYFLAPMRRGIRLTTGVEFAGRDAPKTPVQLARAEPVARELFPLGERLDPEPWMGARPCTPDMLPVIGAAPKHDGLWFAFGHAHHGLTLGPTTGRLIAELVVGDAPYIDPAPFSAARFA